MKMMRIFRSKTVGGNKMSETLETILHRLSEIESRLNLLENKGSTRPDRENDVLEYLRIQIVEHGRNSVRFAELTDELGRGVTRHVIDRLIIKNKVINLDPDKTTMRGCRLTLPTVSA
jgi:hypothetical protein